MSEMKQRKAENSLDMVIAIAWLVFFAVILL